MEKDIKALKEKMKKDFKRRENDTGENCRT